jgi:hypothetical protein
MLVRACAHHFTPSIQEIVMRPRLVAMMTAVLFFSVAWCGRAQDDEVRGLLDRAIRAMGGVERIQKYQAGRVKAKGKIEVMGANVDFSQDMGYQLPDKFRQSMQIEVNGMQLTINTIYDGKKYGMDINGQKLPADDKLRDILRDSAYQMQVGRLVLLREKGFELTTLGEVQVNGKPALGIRIVKKDRPDVNIYLDKETSLPAKIENRTRDFATGQEVTEERIILEYKTEDGNPIPKRVEVMRDGKKFMEVEVLETRYLEKIDDSEFVVE